MKNFIYCLLFFICGSAIVSAQTQCPIGTGTYLLGFNGDANVPNPSTAPHLKPDYTGSWLGNSLSFSDLTKNSAATNLTLTAEIVTVSTQQRTVIRVTGTTAGVAPTSGNNYIYTQVTIPAGNPILQLSQYKANFVSTAFRFSLTIFDVTSSGETALLTDQSFTANITYPISYKMLPGRTYQVRIYPTGASPVQLDNPELYGYPVPNVSTTAICANPTTNTVDLNSSLINTVAPVAPFASIRWFSGSSTTASSVVGPGTYTARYYNTASSCNGPASAVVTVNQSAGITTQPSPATQTRVVGEVPTALTGLVASGTSPTYQWYSNTTNNNTSGVLISGATSSTYSPPTKAIVGTDYYYVVVSNSCSSVTSSVIAVNFTAKVCMKAGNSGGQNLDSNVGILTKNKTRSNWPTEVRNGYLVLDSNTKGFVISYVDNVNQIVNPIKGMMVYDTSAQCVKLYRGTSPTINSTKTGWNCIAKACND